VFWQPNGVQDFVVKAFLMEVTRTQKPGESMRNPTWFSAEEARKILAKGRELKYAAELQTVIDRAVDHVRTVKMIAPTGPEARGARAPQPS
jgi:hypothetical protein